MREVLFRAKRLDNGEWVEGNLIFSNDAEEGWEAIIIPITNSNMFTKGETKGNLGFENWHMVDPKTVCQYTGMTDRNGKKIWENNIVQMFYRDGGTDTGTIRYTEQCARFQYYEAGEIGYGIDITCDMEVIGDIFDNPELLKGGAE